MTGRAAVAGLFAPMLLSWGLGTANPVLDALALPAAWIGSLPAALTPLGAAAVGLLCLLPLRIPAAARVLEPVAAIGVLTLLASASAATRPLPWVPILVVAALATRGRAATGWALPSWSPWAGAAIAWPLAARVRPFGPGLLPAAVEDAIATSVDAIPDAAEPIVVLLLCAGLAAALRRTAAPDRVGAAIGAAAAIAVVGTFGREQAYVSAAAIGAVLGAWAPSRKPESWVAPMLVACLLGAVRLGVMERWNCSHGHDSRVTKFLLKRPVDDLAILPGNLPFLVTLGEDGAELQRFSTTGTVNGTAPLDPPGGRLLATQGAIPSVVRMVGGEQLRVEWWEAATLERRAARELGPCSPSSAAWEPGAERVWIRCEQGTVIGVPAAGDVVTFEAPGEAIRDATGALLVLTRGPRSRVTVTGDDGAVRFDVPLGPFAEDVAVGPGRLVVARGPTGLVEFRGPKAVIEGWSGWFPKPDEPGAGELALRTVLDRVRAGLWPGRVDWVGAKRAAYVTSPIDGVVRMVDAEVGWHQHAEHLGAPPRQVVVDPGSGTLYGVNRCGVFEVRIASTFPWSSSGDVEPVPNATPTPSPTP